VAELPAVTDADFEEKVLRREVPVLVDFFGSWCVGCIRMKPMLAELAKELEGKALFFQAEVEEVPETAAKYGIMSVPTLIVFSGGEAKETLTGNVTRAGIAAAVTRHVRTK
jgi:thioredoxin 1